jgi:glycosyltransferase involved in cell wall biosynthesis
MKKKEKLVSVIIPTYNRAYILPRTLKTVLEQTYKNWEVIIVDDSSEDNTQEIIEKYSKKDNRIKCIKNTHKKGPAGARNCGIEESKGEYIAFIDSDDEWMKSHLKDSIEAMEYFNADFCSSRRYFEKDGKLHKNRFEQELDKINKEINRRKPKKKGDVLFFENNANEKFFFQGIFDLFFWTSVMVIKKDVFKESGFFNEKLVTFEDIELYHRIFIKFNFCFIKKYSAIWHEGTDNLYRFKGNIGLYEETKLKRGDPLLLKNEIVFKTTIKGLGLLKKRVPINNIFYNQEIETLNRAIKENYDYLIRIKIIQKRYFTVLYLLLKERMFKPYIKESILLLMGKIGKIIKKISQRLYYLLGGKN